jgi:hypothetical protein
VIAAVSNQVNRQSGCSFENQEEEMKEINRRDFVKLAGIGGVVFATRLYAVAQTRL